MDVAVLLLFTAFLTVTFRYDVPLNVAASRGVGALRGCLRGRALAGSGPAAVVAGATSACSPGSVTGSGEQAADYSPAPRRDRRLTADHAEGEGCDRSLGG